MVDPAATWVVRLAGTIGDDDVRRFVAGLAPAGDDDLRDAVRRLGPIRILDLREVDGLGERALDLIGVLLRRLTPGYTRMTVVGASPAIVRRLSERGLDAVISFSPAPGAAVRTEPRRTAGR